MRPLILSAALLIATPAGAHFGHTGEASVHFQHAAAAAGGDHLVGLAALFGAVGGVAVFTALTGRKPRKPDGVEGETDEAAKTA